MNVYQDLLYDLNEIKENFKDLTPRLMSNIQNLELDVRYIMPYVENVLLTEEESYEELKRRFRIEDWPKGLDNFVDYMIERTLLLKEIAKKFYFVHKNNSEWRKFNGVLRDLKYVQSLEGEQIIVAKEKVNGIQGKLRALRGFQKLVVRWNFQNFDCTKAKIQNIYDNIEALPGKAVNLFKLIIIKYTHKSKYQGIDGDFSDLLQIIDSAQLQAKEVYFDILERLNLPLTGNCPVKHATLCLFINKLRNILKKITCSKESLEHDVGDIQLEVEFIRSILVDPLKELVANKIIGAITTHADILAAEAMSVTSSSASSRNHYCSRLIIKLMKSDFREMNRDNHFEVCLDKFLHCLQLLVDNNVLSIAVPQNLVAELKLLRPVMKEREKLVCVIPEFKDMCEQFEGMFQEAWLDIQLCFFGKLSTKKDHVSLCSGFLKDIAVQVSKANDLSLDLVNTLINNLIMLSNSDASMVVPVKHHLETLQRKVNVLRCVLINLLRRYFEEEDLDDLFKDIKTGIIQGDFIYHLLFKEINENIHFSLAETVQCFKATVRQVYLKFAKLSPSKLPKSELEFSDILVDLTELKKCEAHLTACNASQITMLHDDLVMCGSFLKNNLFKHNQGMELKHLWTQIMNVGCKVENAIDTFEEVPNCFSTRRLSDIIEEVNFIKEEITKIYGTNKIYTRVGGSDGNGHRIDKYEVAERFKDGAKAPESQDKFILGFEDEENTLKRQLTTGRKQLQILSIVGMPGVGKTSLATEVYKDVADSFHTHAWCYVSPDFQKKQLLQHIISEINGHGSEINELLEEDLAVSLYRSLFKKKYLIILDDVWDIKAWNALKSCFPPGNNGSRILLTSRFKPIGLQASLNSFCLELEPLPIEKSWHLLKKKVFGEGTCPVQLGAVGKKIAKRSGGLPLTIVLIAGVLKNTEKEEDKWQKVSESLDSLLGENGDGVFSKIELSYNHLSVSMKKCFLSCGAFLRGKEISRSKLVKLWIAERFIEETDHQLTLEDAAELCLRDLVDRSLLIVARTGSLHQIKTCRIHDLLRYFSLQKAEEEKFLEIRNRWKFFPMWQRRLCFHSSWEDFTKFELSLLSTPRIRSLMFFGTGYERLYGLFEQSYKSRDISFICEKFKLLNLLDLECCIVGNSFPESLTELILLRYLAVRGPMNHIPSSIGKLLNLEIFIVRGALGEVHIPQTIFNLTKLRHLLVDNCAIVTGDGSCNTLNNLQSFSSPALCQKTAESIIGRLPNLRKLRCMFLVFWDETMKCNVFPVLKSLCQLESLKVFYLGRVPLRCKFSLPSSLKKLTLCKFRLPWSVMVTIAELPQLEVLKLSPDAFEGQRWETSTTFPNLKYLRFDTLDIEEWEASDDHFPRLEELVVQRCKQLKSIPSAFSDIETLKCIKVHACQQTVFNSASIIEVQQKNSGNKQFKTINSIPSDYSRSKSFKCNEVSVSMSAANIEIKQNKYLIVEEPFKFYTRLSSRYNRGAPVRVLPKFMRSPEATMLPAADPLLRRMGSKPMKFHPFMIHRRAALYRKSRERQRSLNKASSQTLHEHQNHPKLFYDS